MQGKHLFSFWESLCYWSLLISFFLQLFLLFRYLLHFYVKLNFLCWKLPKNFNYERKINLQRMIYLWGSWELIWRNFFMIESLFNFSIKQCENLRIFLLLKCHVKSSFRDDYKNCYFSYFWRFWILKLINFGIFWGLKFTKIKIQSPINCKKGHCKNLWKSQNWFHEKSVRFFFHFSNSRKNLPISAKIELPWLSWVSVFAFAGRVVKWHKKFFWNPRWRFSGSKN